MRILKLRFSNLNSLAGNFTIDFTVSEYNGIFAIIGPTGAGKSTILDAICLALYGRTPRLTAISKKSNEIMSRLTGECFAEVIFEVGTSKFRCHWSQRRVANMVSGNLADSKHEVSDADTGKILASKKREVAKVIEDKTGMDFDRFTRSILLAQGGFSAFIQAQPSDRAPILERITGTGIYSDISQYVHRRHREEKVELDNLKAGLGRITYFSDTEEALLKKELKDKGKIESELKNRVNGLNEAILWYNEIDGIRVELSRLSEEHKDLLGEIELFKLNKDKLDRANKANTLKANYEILLLRRKELRGREEVLREDNKKLPILKEKLRGIEGLFERNKSNTINSKNEKEEGLKLINEVRILDSRVASKEKELIYATDKYNKVKEQLKGAEGKRFELAKVEKGLLRDLEKVKGYLVSSASDERLVSEFTGIKGKIEGLKSLYDDLLLKKDKVKECKGIEEKDRVNYKQQCNEVSNLKDTYQDIDKQVTAKEGILKDHLKDYSLKEHRDNYNRLLHEMLYQKKIVDFEDERQRLEDNSPCPLCGSLDHPFASNNIPQLDDTEKEVNILSTLISMAEELEGELKVLEDKKEQLKFGLNEANNKLSNVEHKLEVSMDNLERLTGEKDDISDSINRLEEALLLGLSPFGINELVSPDSLLSGLADRLKNWEQYKREETELEAKKNNINLELKGTHGTIETINRQLNGEEDNINALGGEHEALLNSRNSMYGSRVTDDEERRLDNLVKEAENCEATSKLEMDNIRVDLGNLVTRISGTENDISKKADELDNLESSFLTNCIKVGFDGEEDFISAKMSDMERDTLTGRDADLDKKKYTIEKQIVDKKASLSKELDKSLTDKPLNSLRDELDENNNTLEKLREEVGAIKQKLLDNDSSKEDSSSKLLLVERQQEEFGRWDSLHSLIGSADGKKYRNFAQGVTFEFMLSYANRQLKKMTDRYLLIRSDEPLELSIIDSYQAGEVRSIKNLSGGESFIVSLSLALGLSDMASHNVRVDSLFLDEGFGTLDEDSLAVVLEALANLQQDGKLIGIISHISALKEWIGTQIVVKPSGARSILTGPGCVSS